MRPNQLLCKFRKSKRVESFNLLTIDQAIEESELAASYHAYWYDEQMENDNSIPNVGSADWHLHWIDVHMSAAYYLRS